MFNEKFNKLLRQYSKVTTTKQVMDMDMNDIIKMLQRNVSHKTILDFIRARKKSWEVA